MDAVASVRESRTVVSGDGSTLATSGARDESPLVTALSEIQMDRYAEFAFYHGFCRKEYERGCNTLVVLSWHADLQTVEQLTVSCPRCVESFTFDRSGKEVKA